MPPYVPTGINSLVEIDNAEGVEYPEAPVEIEGVVGPGSQGGWFEDDDDYQVHCLDFVGWRNPGEPLNRRMMCILRAVPKGADYFDDFPPHSLQRFRLFVSDDKYRAIFVEALDPPKDDAELSDFVTEIQKPVVVQDSVFGELTLNRELDWFEGEGDWNGQTIRFSILEDCDEPCGEVLESAKEFWGKRDEWRGKIESHAVNELLELKNEGWLDDDEPELTREQFLEHMEIESISFSYDTEFEIWFRDGGMFGGHAIMVSGNLQEGVTDAGIHG